MAVSLDSDLFLPGQNESDAQAVAAAAARLPPGDK